jgi:hypothetical protein
MATNTPTDDNFRQSARKLGTLTRQRTIRGFLGFNSRGFDLDDYYSFNLKGSSSAFISLRGLKENADLRLLDSEGAVIRASTRRGTSNERIVRALEAGRYFVQVSQDGVRTPYRLILAPGSAPSGGGGGGGTGGGGGITPPSDPGSFPATAFDTGRLRGEKTYAGTVGAGTTVRGRSGDIADFYEFTIDRSSIVDITTSAGVNTILAYDITGNGIVDGSDQLAEGASISKALGAGTYYVGITPGANIEVGYTVRLKEEAVENIRAAGNDPPIGLGGANDLGVLGPQGISFKQFVSTSDSSNRNLVGTFESTDIYKFTLTAEASTFTALLDSAQLTGNVTVSLIYDENGNGIANPGQPAEDGGGIILGDFPGGFFTGSSADGAAGSINKPLGAGTYYIAVTQRDVTDNTAYTLSLFANPIAGISPINDPTNTSIRTAINIGPLTQNVTYKQFVGAVDDSDVYTFTLTQPRNIIIRYDNSEELALLRFGTDYNGNGFLDRNEDLDNDRELGLGEDLNNNGVLDLAEDTNRDGKLNPGEDVNGNGILDDAEDTNNNGILDRGEDLNGNGILDRDVFEPDEIGNVVYNPLPPFANATGDGRFDTQRDGFLTSGIATDIYARLPAGTYVFQIIPQAIETDLGDAKTRYGSANILYNLSFILEPPV